jgi:uncharacterized membrane protein (DUF2068 family)
MSEFKTAIKYIVLSALFGLPLSYGVMMVMEPNPLWRIAGYTCLAFFAGAVYFRTR